jgi:hypothetical protein
VGSAIRSFLCWSLTALPFGEDRARCQISERTPIVGFVRAENLLGKVPERFLLLFPKRRLDNVNWFAEF